jgi:uncharacterized protein
MLTSKSKIVALAVLLACGPLSGAYAADAAKFKSSAAALQQGLALYKNGAFAQAIAPLEFAVADNQFMAQFTLAQLYADNTNSETDHAKAYMLYQTIADENSDVDPDDETRAPFVAKALTALAGYLRLGMTEINLKPDPERAADYLHHAALFFGDEDAQFELVKLKLKGEGIPADVASAKHWLSVLTQRGHAGAQAFLADLYWRGKFMDQDKVRAYALIEVAVENAPPRERIWIEDIHQNIFCGAGEGIRQQATGMVAEWRSRYGRKPNTNSRPGFEPLVADVVRTCQNGDKVIPVEVPMQSAGRNLPKPNLPALPLAGFAQGPISGESASGQSSSPSMGLRDITSKSISGSDTGLSHGLLQRPSER